MMSLRNPHNLFVAFVLFAGAISIASRSGAAAQDVVVVPMIGNVFVPTTLTVSVGTTVTWPNNEDPNGTDVIHDVVTDDYTTINSGDINPGASFSFTFTAPGTYHYFCDYHSLMDATITVQ